MPSREDIERYTQALGAINLLIPVGAQLAFLIADGIKSFQGRNEEVTKAEAQAALDKFAQATGAAKTQIRDWLATHPPEPE